MSKMYYAETPDAAHDIHDLKVNLLGESFQFYTDAGVFSKKMIDFGSQVLLSALDLEAGKTLLDVGCGYGPLGISLAKVQGVKVTMIDINSRAILFLIHLSVLGSRWFIKLLRRHMIISIKVVT